MSQNNKTKANESPIEDSMKAKLLARKPISKPRANEQLIDSLKAKLMANESNGRTKVKRSLNHPKKAKLMANEPISIEMRNKG
eukprot:CAMPEP_0119345400 /NCGR_PEP_ID=MMETSP1333-20130426/107467_1 /TAXON_ID=418940 /ORGANISM="Scyphosphaera apsteinii, Strain RCC1455" /LENGTH=82 /DNA_ID=CAMNT_0007357869 /DNA_START=923 /DNA_END=1171 /DNA_ORIENTATION=+